MITNFNYIKYPLRSRLQDKLLVALQEHNKRVRNLRKHKENFIFNNDDFYMKTNLVELCKEYKRLNGLEA